jgi:hypothetical protein
MTLVKLLFEYGFRSQTVVRVDVSRNQEKNILKFEKTKQMSEIKNQGVGYQTHTCLQAALEPF